MKKKKPKSTTLHRWTAEELQERFAKENQQRAACFNRLIGHYKQTLEDPNLGDFKRKFAESLVEYARGSMYREGIIDEVPEYLLKCDKELAFANGGRNRRLCLQRNLWRLEAEEQVAVDMFFFQTQGNLTNIAEKLGVERARAREIFFSGLEKICEIDPRAMSHRTLRDLLRLAD